VPSLTSSRFDELAAATATRLRPLWQLPAFAAIGIGLSLIFTPIRNPLVLCFGLIAPPLAVFVLLPGLRDTLRKLIVLPRSLTTWHWLLLFIVLSGLTFRLRDVQDIDSAPVDGWALFRVLLECVVVGVLLLRLFGGSTPWLRVLFRGPIWLLSAFVLFCAASASWSVRWQWTLYKSFEYGIGLALVAALVVSASSRLEYAQLLNWMWALIGLAAIVVWLGAMIAPADAFSYGQDGIFPIPELSGVWPLQAANSVGDLGALLSIVALARLLLTSGGRQSQRFHWLVLAFGLATMFMAQCRSAIGGFIFGTLLLLVLVRRAVVGAIIGAACSLIALFTGFGSSLWTYLLRSQQAEQFSSLSGRLDWWAAAWGKIIERPLIGWGGFAGGRFVVLAGASNSVTADIHSTIMETLLDVGVLGLLFLILALMAMWRILWRGARRTALGPNDRAQCIECLAVLAVLSVRSLFSSTLVAHSYSTVTFLLIAGYSEYVRRMLRRARHLAAHPLEQ
jgi:O-antigen ligase